MISNMDQKTETFLRKRNETLSSISANLKSIDISLKRIADTLTEIGEGYPATREELANAGVKEKNDGRTSA